ncbi:MAG: hypothetical protein QM679_06585 [Patulibacter sp.]
MGHQRISQRDLRLRSKAIMDSVEHGESFTVTRDGHPCAELIPLRPRRTFVPASSFLDRTAGLTATDAERFRADLDAQLETHAEDPYDR